MFYVCMVLYFLVFISNMLKIYLCNKFICNEEKRSCNSISNLNVSLFLFIPVLNEQQIIRDTFYHFRDIVLNFDNVYVVFVTTNKEADNEKRTYDILCELLNEDNQSKTIVINYPYKNGVMAHQLNYAIDRIKEKMGTYDFWIGIYNADSRINVKTINYVIDKVNNIKCDKFCMQQYSWYYCKKEKQTGIMQSCALWQSRWSVTFEISFFINSYMSERWNKHVSEIIAQKASHCYLYEQKVMTLNFISKNSVLSIENNFPYDYYIVNGETSIVKKSKKRQIVLYTDVAIGECQQDELFSNKRKISLDFFLPSGSYATMLIKQLFVNI